MNFSMVIPLEAGRIPLFINSIKRYEKILNPEKHNVEFVIVSRTIKDIVELGEGLSQKAAYKLITYEWQGETLNGHEVFNPSMALNLGVKNATYDNIIITCPEVWPLTNVFDQFEALGRGNYVSQCFDLNPNGSRRVSLVNKRFRGHFPAFYFLALYKKESIEAINGWDEDYMGGHACEDDDFGERWNRAKIPFEVRDEIQTEHQYHLRAFGWETDYYRRNHQLLKDARVKGTIRCKNGLVKE